MNLFRRRPVLGLIAAPAVLALPGMRGRVPSVRWQGSALGAEATIRLEQVEEQRALRLIRHIVGEIDRLEDIFSLQRATSAISRLNRDGRLLAPPHELVDVLAEALRIHRLSGGAFDPSVQPLWQLHADHFARPGASPGGPSLGLIERVRVRVGLEKVLVSPREIRFARRGMAITLNGIAQGTITDRIADQLRNEGLEHGLICLGEIVAIGGHASGRPWSVMLDRGISAGQRISLHDSALATSHPCGTVFDRRHGRHHHLLDPRTGRASLYARPVTVAAPRAMLADALSTACALVPPEDARTLIVAAGPGVRLAGAKARGPQRGSESSGGVDPFS